MVPPPDVTYLSPTGIKVEVPTKNVAPVRTDGDDDSTSTSWPAVKAHLAGGR
jgi:hypothetical protein